ncbi:MAG: hypothetical protein ACK5L5_00505 [Bacteroidales bacterium]
MSNSFSLIYGGEAYNRKFTLPYSVNEIKDFIIRTAKQKMSQSGLSVYTIASINKDRFGMDVGLRFNMFGEEINNYISIEPRLSARYDISKKLRIKLSGMYNEQALSAIGNGRTTGNINFEAKQWIPLTSIGLEPMSSVQIAGGIHWTPMSKLSVDLEGFYKRINNYTANYLNKIAGTPPLEALESVRQGKTYAYSLRDFGIMLTYTVAKNQKRFEELNNNQWFNADFDVRLNLSLGINYTFIKRTDERYWVSSNFNIHSGTPTNYPYQNIPEAELPLDNNISSQNSNLLMYINGINSDKLPSYHRLDLAMHHERKRRHGSSVFSIGILNVYNRKNTYYFYKSEQNYKQLILYPLMPFISFNRRF